MRRIALQSALGGMLASIAGMIAAVVGILPPIGGAIAQEVIDLLPCLTQSALWFPPTAGFLIPTPLLQVQLWLRAGTQLQSKMV